MTITPAQAITADAAGPASISESRTAQPAPTQAASAALSTGFSAALEGQAAAAASAVSDGLTPQAGLQPFRPLVKHESRSLSPYQKFESFVLQSFVQSMLPSDNESFYGGGTAGNIWRSMLAEQLGDQLARSGGIGIAKMLEKKEDGRAPAPGHAAAATGTADATRAAAAGQAGSLALTGLSQLQESSE